MMPDFNQEIVDAFEQLISDKLDEVHTSSAGKVGGIKDNFTANVTPALTVLTDDGRKIPYPQIPGVKILMPCGSGGTVGFAFPVKNGDGCVSIYGEGGSGSDLKHDLSNAIIIPGLSESASDNVKKAGSENAAVMFAGDTTIVVKKDCVFVTRGSTTIKATDSGVEVSASNVKITGNVDISGNATVSGILTAGGIVMNTHTHAGTHGQTSGPM